MHILLESREILKTKYTKAKEDNQQRPETLKASIARIAMQLNTLFIIKCVSARTFPNKPSFTFL
jgi:hypothetical protein